MNKERIIYDSYNEDRTKIAEYLYQDLKHKYGWDSLECVPEEMIDQELDLITDFAMDEINMFFNGDNMYLIMGTIGTWRGPMKGGFVFSTLNQLRKAWKYCDYIKIYDVNGHLYIKCSHHDGTNYFEVKMLTEKGKKYINDIHTGKSNREIHTTIWNSNFFSKLPHYAYKVFGAPKRETA